MTVLSLQVCPICQEGMSVAQALTYCRKSCGNNMHVKCMKMYAEFQRSSTGTKVRGPFAFLYIHT
jgi:E3 ubiquitin-protein ligase ZSWIM2